MVTLMDTLGCYMLQLGRRLAGAGVFLAFVLCLGWAPLALTQQTPRPQGVPNCAIHDGGEPATDAALARGETVMLDAWFNSQQRVNAVGQKEYFHYKWDDDTNTGYSCLGSIFTAFGAKLDTLYSAPTLEKLKGAQYYIIVSPDNPARNSHPNYVQSEDAEQVAEWVKQGGVLLLMENDPANADIDHLDLIADRFGIHFNDVLSHHVVGDDFPSGTFTVKGGGPIFHDPHTIYMKDTCTISIKPPARALLEDKGDIMMATAKYGKGTVVAVTDPWLYNEYTDGRKKLPVEDNYAAGKEFVRWLIEQRQRETGSAANPSKIPLSSELTFAEGAL